MNRIQKISFFVVASLYSIGFLLFESHLLSVGSSEKTIAIIGCSHNLISTGICAFIFLKAGLGRAGILWAFGFITVGIADAFHGLFNWVYPLDYLNPGAIIVGELYSLFVVFHLIAAYSNFLEKTRKEILLYCVVFISYMCVVIWGISVPFWKLDFPAFMSVLDMIYNVLTAAFVGVLFVAGVRSKKNYALFFISSYLLVFCSDFAIRHFDNVRGVPELTIFNYGWELGYSFIAVVLAWVKLNGLKLETLFEKVPYNSLRFQVSAIGFSVTLFVIFSLRAIDIPHSIWQHTDMSIILTVVLIAWMISNLTALWLSNKMIMIERLVARNLYRSHRQYEIEKIVGIYEDKNEVLRKANQLITEQKESIEMTSKQIAHDVRKPLAGVKSLLYILPEIKDNPDMLERMSKEVDRNIIQTNSMLDELLEFSKKEISLDQDVFDPRELILSAVTDAIRSKKDTDVSIGYELKAKNSLYVDEARMVRVFTNIIGNAIEAMRGQGNLWIGTEDNDDRIILTIGNDGPIIPKEVINRLFEPFFTKGKKGGTGLGLAICKKIIESHGGTIKVLSTEIAKGKNSTEFIIELPARPGDNKLVETKLIYHSKEFELAVDSQL